MSGTMGVREFLAWNPDDWRSWQLVDGTPRMVGLSPVAHGALLAEVGGVVGNHLHAVGDRGWACMRVGVVPRVRAGYNLRLADLAVAGPGRIAGEHALSDPVLIVEVVSPGEEQATWDNVWAYATIPELREVAVLWTDMVRAEVLRRGADGAWAPEPEVVERGDLVLDSIGLRTGLLALYRGTPLNPDKG